MKPDCAFFELQLTEYTSGTLSAGDCARLARHLAVCDSCRAEAAREEELRKVLGNLPTIACPAMPADQFTDQASGRRVARWPWAIGMAAAVLLAIVLVPGILPGSSLLMDQAAHGPEAPHKFTVAEVAQARRDLLTTLALAVDVLDHSRDRTMVQVFARQLPRAVAGSLNRLDSPTRKTDHNPITTGGKG